MPGTRWILGLVALIDLVPAVGDAAGAGLATFVMQQAARLGEPV